MRDNITVTQNDIDRVAARRACFEPIATAVGLVYDDGNEDLMCCLETILMIRNSQAVMRSKPGQMSTRAQRPANNNGKPNGNAPVAGGDVGDAAVRIMAERRGKVLVAAQPAKGK